VGTPRSIFFIGLDGAEPALIHRWMRDGSLPVLAELHSRGVAGDVETLPGMGDGATWPTIVTGSNPARHGRYFRRQLEPGSYGIYKFDIDTHLKQPPFWRILSEAGRKVAILDIPYTPTTRDLNGVCMVDWLIHDRYGPPRGYPDGFAEDVLARLGDDPVGGNTDRIPKDGASLKGVVDGLVERVGMKERLVCDVLTRGKWDFLATVFAEPHDIGHVAWHMHDAEHRDHDPDWVARNGDPLRSVYQAIDTSIGRCLSDLDPETVVMVFIGLGMGPNYTLNHVIQQALDRLDGKSGADPFSFRKYLGMRRWQGLAGKLVGRATKLATRADRALMLRRLERSRFFTIEHNENSAAIRVNVKGREPSGRVKPEDLAATCDELTSALVELVDPITGNPVVKRVVRVTDHFEGDSLSELPDLFVEWNRETPFDAATSKRTGEIGPATSWGRSGDHTSHAMLIAAGPGIRAGRFANKPKLVDIAATVGTVLTVDMSGLEGQAVPEIVCTATEVHAPVDSI
jgi:predicted AlkP superfamily phosphohydrolase/phosphomutase